MLGPLRPRGASYAVFLAVSGFEFDQASGRLAFAPVIQQDHFRTPFTTSGAWGTYEQKDQQASINITHGRLVLRKLDLALFRGKRLNASLNGAAVETGRLELKAGDVLKFTAK